MHRVGVVVEAHRRRADVVDHQEVTALAVELGCCVGQHVVCLSGEADDDLALCACLDESAQEVLGGLQHDLRGAELTLDLRARSL